MLRLDRLLIVTEPVDIPDGKEVEGSSESRDGSEFANR